MEALESVGGEARARTLLRHPMRLRILDLARRESSATSLAAALGETRQRVNYHVRELARAGFLRRAGSRRRRGLVERRWIATARAYVLAPDVLGALEPKAGDAIGAAALLTLAAQIQSELGRSTRAAAAQGRRVATLSLECEVRFADAAQRARFAAEIQAAVTRAVARHTSKQGRPFRVALGCYPIPKESDR